MLISDTHLHSAFSSDSEASMENMIRQGIHLGLKTLCFTEHFDLDYPENEEGLDFLLDFDAYHSSFLTLKDKYSSRIELLHGIEVGVQPHLKKELASFYEKYGSRYDFILNSCHIVNGEDPYEPAFFENYSPKTGLRLYFKHILRNVQVFPHFQSAAHLDYICRYFPAPRPAFCYEEYAEILDEILLFLIQNGKALEVNTAGLKHGLAWPNPHLDILKRYRALGGELITVGSDAHKPEDMAYAFDRLGDILTEAGFSYYALFREKKPEFIPVL